MLRGKPINLRQKGVLLCIALLAFTLDWRAMAQRGQVLQTYTSTFGLPSPTFPAGLPPRPEEIRLGEELFHETALSLNNTVSCATCHLPEKAFAESRPLSQGIFGRVGTRNAPTILNAAFMDTLNWDGAHGSLEEQAISALTGPREMGVPINEISTHIEPKYGARLRALYGDSSPIAVARAIAAYERTLVMGDSPFDRYLYGGDRNALNESAKRGFQVFLREGRCVLCHTIRCDECHPFGGKLATFTDNRFHNIGIGFDKNGDTSDWGRWNVTHAPSDRGAFKTPTLRNIELTAPYMHDGSLATLEEVVEHYNKGGVPNVNLDPDIRPLHLSPTQKNDLIEFLRSLTSTELKPVQMPAAQATNRENSRVQPGDHRGYEQQHQK
jgi:cytochrome c peroxidase